MNEEHRITAKQFLTAQAGSAQSMLSAEVVERLIAETNKSDVDGRVVIHADSGEAYTAEEIAKGLHNHACSYVTTPGRWLAYRLITEYSQQRALATEHTKMPWQLGILITALQDIPENPVPLREQSAALLVHMFAPDDDRLTQTMRAVFDRKPSEAVLPYTGPTEPTAKKARAEKPVSRDAVLALVAHAMKEMQRAMPHAQTSSQTVRQLKDAGFDVSVSGLERIRNATFMDPKRLNAMLKGVATWLQARKSDFDLVKGEANPPTSLDIEDTCSCITTYLASQERGRSQPQR